MIVTLEFYWQSLNFIFQFRCRPFFITLALVGRSVVGRCACVHAYVCPIWLVAFKWICTQTSQFYLRLTDKKTNLLFTLAVFFSLSPQKKSKRKENDDGGNYGYATLSFFFLKCFEFLFDEEKKTIMKITWKKSRRNWHTEYQFL